MAGKRARFARQQALIPVVYSEIFTVFDGWDAERGQYHVKAMAIPWTLVRLHTGTLGGRNLLCYELEDMISSHWQAMPLDHTTGPEGIDAGRQQFREDFFQQLYRGHLNH